MHLHSGLVLGAMTACSAVGHEGAIGGARMLADAPRLAVARTVHGRVLGADGGPVAGALVAVIQLASFRGVGFATTDELGQFALGVPASGAVVTASAPGRVSGVFDTGAAGEDTIRLVAPSATSRTFSGMVRDGTGRPLGGVRVRLMSWGWPVGTAYYVLTRADGRFEFTVERTEDESFDLLVDDPDYVSDFGVVPPGDSDIALTAYDRRAIEGQAARVEEDVVRRGCVPLHGGGLQAVADSVRSARVVGLGESTHGTHEYSVIRRDILELLARDGWLTTIALEASWVDVARLDAYVRRGKGTARGAVARIRSWPWRTEEMVSVVEMIRGHNATQPDERKIEFVGIDYEPPDSGMKLVDRWFASRRTTYASDLAALEPLRRASSWGEVSKLPARARRDVGQAIARLELAADSEWPGDLLVGQALQSLRQIVEDPHVAVRNTLMADSVLALLARRDKQRHVAIWAHNGHVARGPIEGTVPMGDYLRLRLGDDYRAVGTLFYSGSFVTYSQRNEMVTHAVSLPPAHYLEAMIHRAWPKDACALDVAGAQDAPLRHWLDTPMVDRIYGGLEISEGYPWPPVRLPELWSTLIYVPVSTPIAPLGEE